MSMWRDDDIESWDRDEMPDLAPYRAGRESRSSAFRRGHTGDTSTSPTVLSLSEYRASDRAKRRMR